MECVDYIPRSVEQVLRSTIDRRKSVLLLGPRQTGKTTMLRRLGADLEVTLVRPEVRQRYERQPDLLIGEVEALPRGGGSPPLVIIDEIQKVPTLLDVAQYLIDDDKASFILTGSSARKLRRGGDVNLLPGRVVPIRLDPLSLSERLPASLDDLLLYGSLPGFVDLQPSDREIDLDAYVTVYLEEEIRAEALVRRLGPFSRFLELAAAEAGGIINHRKLSQEIGVAHTTIAAYYQVLEDSLIIERVSPLSRSKTRTRLTKSDRFLFFDLGVRRAAAREGTRPSASRRGELFEHFVGLEILRGFRGARGNPRLRFWRDPSGPEVDWVVEREGRFLPIEVKLGNRPSRRDARHLETFLNEYPEADRALVISTVPRRIQLTPRIHAHPWQDLPELLDTHCHA